jgi:hypothetical protein
LLWGLVTSAEAADDYLKPVISLRMMLVGAF